MKASAWSVRPAPCWAALFPRVGEISALISSISASTETQSAGLQQVNASVSDMDKMTQQNAAMVEESTAAARAALLVKQKNLPSSLLASS